MAKKWMGTKPTTCDICHEHLENLFVDGRTKFGPWGMLCIQCHADKGFGLGLGKGQLYRYNTETKEWDKKDG